MSGMGNQLYNIQGGHSNPQEASSGTTSSNPNYLVDENYVNSEAVNVGQYSLDINQAAIENGSFAACGVGYSEGIGYYSMGSGPWGHHRGYQDGYGHGYGQDVSTQIMNLQKLQMAGWNADTNHDGMVSKGERTVFQSDMNGDGMMNREEFTRFCSSKMPSGMTAEQYQNWQYNVYKRFDEVAQGATSISGAQADQINWKVAPTQTTTASAATETPTNASIQATA